MIIDLNKKRQQIEQICFEKKEIRKVFIAEIDLKKEFKVYKIPVDFFILNPYNSRFESEQQNISNTFSNREDLYKKAGQEKIRKLILGQTKSKNENTKKDLISKGQQEAVIITNDGLLISGNRRFSIIQDINLNYSSKILSLDAVVLWEFSSEDIKKIKELELMIQFGKDASEKYSRFNRMLAMRNFKKMFSQKSDKEITEHFGWGDPGGIKEVLNILDTMDQYLDFFKMKDNYQYVEEKEGRFRYLTKAIDVIKNKPMQSNLDWEPTAKDCNDFTNSMFRFLRFEPELEKFRQIIQVKTSSSIFYNEKIWKNFKEKIDKTYEESEKCRDNFKKSNSKIDPSVLEKKVIKQKKESFDEILIDSLYRVKHLQDIYKPAKLTKRLQEDIDNIEKYYQDNLPFKKEIKKEIKKSSEQLNDLVKQLFNNGNEK